MFGLGPNGDPTGQAVAIVFLIDTAKAPADSFASASIGDYRVERGYGFPLATPDPTLNYVTATWTINGISRTSFLPNRDQIDHIFLSDAAPGSLDAITLRDGRYDGSSTTNTRLFYVALSAILATDVLSGDSLANSAVRSQRRRARRAAGSAPASGRTTRTARTRTRCGSSRSRASRSRVRSCPSPQGARCSAARPSHSRVAARLAAERTRAKPALSPSEAHARASSSARDGES